MKFYRCSTCDQVHTNLIDSNKKTTCCGEEVEELIANDIKDELSNHRPLIRKTGNFVTITVDNNHPIIDVHRIDFVFLETNQGFQYKKVPLNQVVKADFILAKEEEIVNVYIYCNLHLLWSLHSL